MILHLTINSLWSSKLFLHLKQIHSSLTFLSWTEILFGVVVTLLDATPPFLFSFFRHKMRDFTFDNNITSNSCCCDLMQPPSPKQHAQLLLWWQWLLLLWYTIQCNILFEFSFTPQYTSVLLPQRLFCHRELYSTPHLQSPAVCSL